MPASERFGEIPSEVEGSREILAERGIPQNRIQKANKTEEVLVFPST
jgi:hypothetical protein